MRKLQFFTLLLLLFTGCVDQKTYDTTRKQVNSLTNKIDSLQKVSDNQAKLITQLQDSIAILSFPAPQRYNEIESLVSNNQFDEARNKIAQLKKIFPYSSEAQKCSKLISTIDKKEAAIKAEQERIKALGFKVFKDTPSIVKDEVKSTYSGFTFGREFGFGNCSDVGEYSYRTADKNNIYILANLTLSTKLNSAYPTGLIACEIRDGKLYRIAYFSSEYASWSSYGAKIGNYSDDTHDFSKVNSVKYKIAAEITKEQSKQPILIVAMNGDNRFEDGMTVEDVAQKLYVIKILNREKLK